MKGINGIEAKTTNPEIFCFHLNKILIFDFIPFILFIPVK